MGNCVKCNRRILDQYIYCMPCWTKFKNKGYLNTPNAPTHKCRMCSNQIALKYKYCYECKKKYNIVGDGD